MWISQRTLSLCVSIHLWWILIKTLLNIFQPGIPIQTSREGNKPCFMCLSVLGLRTSRGGRGRDPKHLQPFDRGRSFKLWPACWTWYHRLWKPCLLGSRFEGLSTFCGNHQVKSCYLGSEGFGAASVIPLTVYIYVYRYICIYTHTCMYTYVYNM